MSDLLDGLRSCTLLNAMRWGISGVLSVLGMTGIIVTVLSPGALVASGWFGPAIFLASLATVGVGVSIAPRPRWYSLLAGIVAAPFVVVVFFILLD